MSDTRKDKPFWVTHPEKFDNRKYVRNPERNQFSLKPKEVDTEYHWMSTPSWFTNLFMTRPERRRASNFTSQVIYSQDLEEEDLADTKRKPHIYYW